VLFYATFKRGHVPIPTQRYRLNTPTLGVFNQDGEKRPITIPPGAVVKVMNNPLDGNHLIDVKWDGKTIMMFTTDIRERCDINWVLGLKARLAPHTTTRQSRESATASGNPKSCRQNQTFRFLELLMIERIDSKERRDRSPIAFSARIRSGVTRLCVFSNFPRET